MNILLLGGTGFLGTHIARAALARGHNITCVARGTNPAVDGVKFVEADRDHDDALDVVAGDSWNTVIDLTSQPHHARQASAQLRAQHAIYVSSSSVYADQTVISVETDAIVPALDEGFMADMQQYPAAKAACEQAYSTGFERVLIIRPGLIGGHGDVTGRSGYYPWRCSNPTAGEIVAPDPTFPVSMVDAEDVAEWIVTCAEKRAEGVVNAAGATATLAEVLEISQQIAANGVQARVVDDAVLAQYGVSPWMGPESLPLWIPGPDLHNIALLDGSLAQSMGLRNRPLEKTLASALRYERHREKPRQTGLSDEKEREILAAL